MATDPRRRWKDALARTLRAYLTPRLASSGRHQGALLSDQSVDVYTFVTDEAEYRDMIASFRQAGFAGQVTFSRLSDGDCEPFSALTKIAGMPGAPYAILCHQDIRLPEASGPGRLFECLGRLEELDPGWTVAGSAGVVGDLSVARQVYDLWGGFSHHELPRQVMSLDEIFLVLNRRNRPRCSTGVHGFHWYGTDVCVNALADGGAAYAIPYPVIHLGLGDLRPDYRLAYEETLSELVLRWSRNTHMCYIASTIEVVALSRHRSIRRVLASGRLMHLVSNERRHGRLGPVPAAIRDMMPAVNSPGSRSAITAGRQ